ncbi:MAG: acylphosphatase [Eubacteriales bacterium]|nr:acylphosphatase [Eubacteriales bacterium]
MADIRKKIVFHGRVQGVGFRYTARLAADSLGLTGWVKNEWDGTVSMEVQGREMLVNKLLVRLNTDRFIRVEWVDSEDIPVKEDERKFVVKY